MVVAYFPTFVPFTFPFALGKTASLGMCVLYPEVLVRVQLVTRP